MDVTVLGMLSDLLDASRLDRDISSIKAKIGNAAYEVAYGFGQETTLDQVAALALSVRKQT